jgi:hypothetical protein
MTRTFIEVPLFTKRWKEIGLSDDELQALQIMLLKDPENLTNEEKNALKKLVKSLKNEAAKNRR